MQIVDHNRKPTEEWRAGVLTRMRVSALTGAAQLNRLSNGVSQEMVRPPICMQSKKFSRSWKDRLSFGLKTHVLQCAQVNA